MDLSWMAWTWQTGAFFAGIAACLVAMTLLAVLRPEAPREGVLGLRTTRGDRLFLSLLGAAWLHLGCLAVFGPDLLPAATALSPLYAAAVFRWV